MLACIAVSGCVQTRYYPLCVFGPDPRFTSDEAMRGQIIDFVHGVVGKKAVVSFAPNERVIIVKGSAAGQTALKKAWPNSACIGQVRFDEEYAVYKECVYQINVALKGNGLPHQGKTSDSLGPWPLFCGKPLKSRNPIS